MTTSPTQKARKTVTATISYSDLFGFIVDSFAIESLNYTIWEQRRVTDAHQSFLALGTLSIKNVIDVARDIAGPEARLRGSAGDDVTIGDHRPPPGGPLVGSLLQDLLDRYNDPGPQDTDTSLHCDFERLHPFMDGNGRVGRLLWLWRRLHRGIPYSDLPLLQQFYYAVIADSENPH